MANSAQALKRVRQNRARREHNAGRRSSGRTAIKKVLAEIANGDHQLAMNAYRNAVSLLDRLANRGLFHKNKVARIKHRMNLKIKGLVASRE